MSEHLSAVAGEIVAREIVEGQIVDLPAPAPPASHLPIVARVPVAVRAGTLADLPFIDRLQKAHGRALGFLPTMALEGKVRAGQVLVACATGVTSDDCRVTSEDKGISFDTHHSSLDTPLGYLIAADRYLKRDELGCVTQACVDPSARGSLVAAALLQAQFDRSASGCKLYCCWCAQDLVEASAFWEAMGFTAIAFRTGSLKRGMRDEGGGMKKATAGMKADALASSSLIPPPSSLPRARVHIFWQKRIRPSDEATPWWYPSQTGGGALRADRLVFPIPPGVSWRDVRPIVIEDAKARGVHERTRWGTNEENEREVKTNEVDASCPFVPFVEGKSSGRRKRAKAQAAVPAAAAKPAPPARGGVLWFAEAVTEEEVYDGGERYLVKLARPIPATPLPTRVSLNLNEDPAEVAAQEAAQEAAEEAAEAARLAKRKRAKKPAAKIDPRLTALARELRDQWGERQADIVAQATAKHDVKRIARATGERGMGDQPMIEDYHGLLARAAETERAA